MTKLILLHTVVVLHYTRHMKMARLVKRGGGEAVKMPKTMYYKSLLVANFIISIYNGMYTVLSYDTHQ